MESPLESLPVEYLEHKLAVEFVSNGPSALLFLDFKTFDVLSANRAFEQYIGLEEHHFKNHRKNFRDILLDSDKDRAHQYFSSLKMNEYYGNRYELFHIMKGEEGLLKLFFYGTLLDLEGRKVVALNAFPNISKAQLPYLSSESRELFLETIANIKYGTYEYYMDLDQIHFSEGLTGYFELDDDLNSFKLKTLLELIQEEDRTIFKDSVGDLLNNGNEMNLDLRIITSKGTHKFINISGRQHIYGDDQPTKVVGCVMDITQQKERELNAEEKLLKLNKSNKDLEEFAYVTSHDLQEPLRKVATFSDRLHEIAFDKLDDNSKFYLERIIYSAKGMRQLIDNLLEFSKVSKGKVIYKPIDLKTIIEEVLSDLEVKIQETEAVIKCDQLPNIDADPIQIRMLFLNLVGNSLKFKKKDKALHISVTCHDVKEEEIKSLDLDPQRSYFRISVEDNGIGFEDEYAEKIFDIFQRLHGKAEYAGSGIGLAICKKIVEHHKGYIHAESVKNEGATFHIYLPVKQG